VVKIVEELADRDSVRVHGGGDRAAAWIAGQQLALTTTPVREPSVGRIPG
jgi:hypothetical protein